MTLDARRQLQAKRDAIEAGKSKPGQVLRVVTTPEGKEKDEPAPDGKRQRRKKR